MQNDITLDTLLERIKQSLMAKKEAEQSIYKAEQKKSKSHKEYTLLMDMLRAKDYTI